MYICFALSNHDFWQSYNMLDFSEKSIISNVLSFHFSCNDKTCCACMCASTYVHMYVCCTCLYLHADCLSVVSIIHMLLFCIWLNLILFNYVKCQCWPEMVFFLVVVALNECVHMSLLLLSAFTANKINYIRKPHRHVNVCVMDGCDDPLYCIRIF